MKNSLILAGLLVAASALHAQPATPAAGGGHMDMKAMMQDMNKDMMAMPMSGDPDRDFAMMMRRHHQGAIDMGQAYLKTGKDKKLVSMTQKMIREQKKEIAELTKVLERKPAKK